jgi:ABC-type glycerol-3-phosphate transport system substrate-binding protein
MRTALLLLVLSAVLVLGGCASSGSAEAGKGPTCDGALTSTGFCDHGHEYAGTPSAE